MKIHIYGFSKPGRQKFIYMDFHMSGAAAGSHLTRVVYQIAT